jgi:hypothetical protein
MNPGSAPTLVLTLRRRYVIFPAIIGTLAGCAVATALPGSGSSPSPRSTHPPRPSLRTLGVTQAATLVSYCWSYRTKGGGGVGQCVDGTLANPAQTLRWRPRVPVRLDLHLPAHGVRVDAYRQPSGPRARDTRVRIHLHRVDSAGRRWVFYVPPATKDHTDLAISAIFTRGDVFAEIGLRKAKGPPASG